jgi:hypothetical protein
VNQRQADLPVPSGLPYISGWYFLWLRRSEQTFRNVDKSGGRGRGRTRDLLGVSWRSTFPSVHYLQRNTPNFTVIWAYLSSFVTVITAWQRLLE